MSAIGQKPLVMPRHFRVTQEVQTLTISWRWFKWQTLVVAALCVFWNFKAVAYGQALGPDASTREYLVYIIMIAVGIAMSYYTLGMLVNRTTVTAGRGQLRVSHGPLPWLGGLALESTRVRQFYVKSYESRSKRTLRTLYAVRAKTLDHEDLNVVGELEQEAEARYIEQALERYLRLEDTPVKGEVRRPTKP